MGTLFFQILTFDLSSHEHQTPPDPPTYLPTHLSHYSYLSLFILIYLVACYTRTNPTQTNPNQTNSTQPNPSKKVYFFPPVILGCPLGECIRMDYQ